MAAGRKPLLTAPAVRVIRREYDTAKAADRRPKMAQFTRRYGLASATAVHQIAVRMTYKWVRP